MRPLLAARLSRALVACYPPRWKQRYREEMLEVLDQHQASPRTVLSLAGGALTARERRRPYEITAAGQEVLAGQLRSMQQLVRVGRQRTATA